MQDTQHQATFNARLLARKAEGTFEIVCMSAGTGNGWQIEAAPLRDSLALWDNANSFVDHKRDGHSIRDLCGVITSPHWNEAEQGIVAQFAPLGPAKDIALACAEDALTNPLAGAIGFSADILFTANGKKIARFEKVNSVDLVINPARGGKFLRALNQLERIPIMEDQDLQATQKDLEALEKTQQRLQAQKDDDTTRSNIQAELEQAKRLRIQMCASVLQMSLASSKLPTAVQDRIRADFKDRTFEPDELEKRIEADRDLLSKLSGAGSINGPRVINMFSAEDQVTAAAFDLLGAKRDDHLKNVTPHRLTGIRELYHILTGDFDLHGGYNPARAMFQLTTTNFPGIVKNALNKLLVEHWNEFGRAGYNWWENIATVEHFTSLNDVTWMIFGTIASLPTVTEGAEYTPLKLGDSPETSSFVKKGGYVGVTLEAIDRDDVRAFRAIPRELAFAGIRELSATVAALFTANSSVGPTLADGGALFNATAVTTAGGHANLLTTAIGTDYVAWEAVATAMYNQPMLVAGETGYYGTGKKLAVDPKFCLVPRALRGSANNLFLSRNVPGASVAISSGKEWYGMVIPLTVPEWTDTTDWAAVADPKLVPGVMIGERFGLVPEIFIAGNETDPAVFMNDESRFKVRHILAVGVADFRPLHKSNV